MSSTSVRYPQLNRKKNYFANLCPLVKQHTRHVVLCAIMSVVMCYCFDRNHFKMSWHTNERSVLLGHLRSGWKAKECPCAYSLPSILINNVILLNELSFLHVGLR